MIRRRRPESSRIFRCTDVVPTRPSIEFEITRNTALTTGRIGGWRWETMAKSTRNVRVWLRSLDLYLFSPDKYASTTVVGLKAGERDRKSRSYYFLDDNANGGDFRRVVTIERRKRPIAAESRRVRKKPLKMHFVNYPQRPMENVHWQTDVQQKPFITSNHYKLVKITWNLKNKPDNVIHERNIFLSINRDLNAYNWKENEKCLHNNRVIYIKKICYFNL